MDKLMETNIQLVYNQIQSNIKIINLQRLFQKIKNKFMRNMVQGSKVEQIYMFFNNFRGQQVDKKNPIRH